MKHIQEILTLNNINMTILDSYLESDRFTVLDIETTGLSPIYGSVILIGLIEITPDECTLHQFFADSPDEESLIISEAVNKLKDANYIVTYNGRMFDIPFLIKRARKYDIEFPSIFNLDLFLLFKYYSDFPKFLTSLSQKSMEEYAGISNLRQDNISGMESVEDYLSYLSTGDSELLERILLHNSDDVKQLYRLMSLIKNTDMHRSLYKTGFPIDGGKITNISIKSDMLSITGTSKNPIEYIHFSSVDQPYNLKMSKSDGGFSISVPLDKKDKNIYMDVHDLLNENYKVPLLRLPGYVNDYIILKDSSGINYIEVNLLSKAISEMILAEL